MKPPRRNDLAADLAIGLLLGVGAACWAGLVAAQLGCFRLAPLVAVGLIAAAVGTGLARRGRGAETGDHQGGSHDAGRLPLQAASWRGLDGPVVFGLLLILYAPGYDTTLYGSDATAYLGNAVHIARSGALAIDDPLLARLPRRVKASLFPVQGGGLGAPRWRSPSGFVYRRFTSQVYSTYSQLPSVWLALGFAAGGLPGALLTTPLLAAGGLTAFYIFVRRLMGAASALLAVGLLGVSVPQIMFARLSMGEVGAQFFLWGGLLAYSRWVETRARVAAVATGVGFGLAALARPEFLVFLPVSGVVLWLLGSRGGSGGHRLPASAVVIATALAAHAWMLMLFVVPSHYAFTLTGWAIGIRIRLLSAVLGPLANEATLVAVLGLVVALLAAIVWVVRASRVGARMRAWVVVAVGLCIAFAYLGPQPGIFPGTAATWFPSHYVLWPVMVVAAVGMPLLARRWWREPSARLALVIGAIAACCFLYDPHVVPIPLWAGRRFLPVVLPLLFAAAAAPMVRLGRVVGLVGAGALLVASLLPARPYLLGPAYLSGTSAAAAEVAALVPSDGLVLIDHSLSGAELDVALTLMHGRDAVQITRSSRPVERAELLLPLTAFGQVFLLRDAFRPPPNVPGLHFEAAGSKTFSLMLGRHVNGVPASSEVTVRALRVQVDTHWFRERVKRGRAG